MVQILLSPMGSSLVVGLVGGLQGGQREKSGLDFISETGTYRKLILVGDTGWGCGSVTSWNIMV